jgi:hypothetical protein
VTRPSLLPTDVMPEPIARAVPREHYWFVIGGQAVRCLYPYRPSRDVDFGVGAAKDVRALVGAFKKRGKVEIVEQSTDTVHFTFDGVAVSVFALPRLVPFTEGMALGVTGLLATKLHAILDRGTRRDFFDLYVLLCEERLGISECLAAIRTVYATEVNDGLLLRALCYFEEASAEARLPGEGPNDWRTVTRFFERAVGALVVPPTERLSIQSRRVDVREPDLPAKKKKRPARQARPKK